jgi:hypothetical protein
MRRGSKIKKVVTKVRLNDKKTDKAYWRERSYTERLAALEEIRQEYHQWKYSGESRMQKAVKIIRLNKKEDNKHQDLAD